MNIYDIHTHSTLFTDNDCIYNIYPQDAEAILSKKSQAFFSCGVHPWYSDNAVEDLQILEKILSHRQVVAVGECGYDTLRGASMDIQRCVFEQQVALSEAFSKPLIIHCVRAWEQLLASYKKMKPTQAWIIHGYRGNKDLTKQLLPFNFYFSVGENFNIEALKIIPLERIFCETDESKYSIEQICQKMSKELDVSFDNLVAQLAKNVKKIFPELES